MIIGASIMIIPTPVEFDTIVVAAVISQDLTNYFIKCNDSSVLNLATGLNAGVPAPNSLWTPFPAAAVVLG